MLVSKLLPLLVMGGIGLHSGGTIKDRLAGVVGAKDKMMAKQRMVAILNAASLNAAIGDTLDVGTPAKFRTWVRKNVRIQGIRGQDSSVDPWGTPLRGVYRGGILTITSAGADKAFNTKDDVTAAGDVDDI